MHGITSPSDDKRTTPTKEMKRDSIQPPLPMLTMQQTPPLPTLQAMSQPLQQSMQTSQAQSTPADALNADQSSK